MHQNWVSSDLAGGWRKVLRDLNPALRLRVFLAALVERPVLTRDSSAFPIPGEILTLTLGHRRGFLPMLQTASTATKGVSPRAARFQLEGFSSWSHYEKRRTAVGDRGQFSTKRLAGTSEQLHKYDNNQNLDKNSCFRFSKCAYLELTQPSNSNHTSKPHRIPGVTSDFINKN